MQINFLKNHYMVFNSFIFAGHTYNVVVMIEYSQSSIDSLVVHQIGSMAEGEEVRFSRSAMQASEYDSVLDVLKNYFFKPFKIEAYYNFTHEEGLEHNFVYSCAARMFDDPSSFYATSMELATFLHQNSNHPKIKGGEFYVALFSNCVVDGEICSALGIFKSESKETFLKVYMRGDSFELGAQEGINIRKLDKGCLIFNSEREDGFKVCAVDSLNKGQEARFWMSDFLNLKPREDKYFFTNNYLQLCKGFVGEVFNDENNVPRPDQIDLMNRSIDFFAKNPNFDERTFEKEVIRQPEVIDAFQDYKTFFEAEKQLPLIDTFEISKDAVKEEKKYFKSILKLDKNFHVYVHGKRQYLEKGFDSERGLNFYKLYYEVEH